MNKYFQFAALSIAFSFSACNCKKTASANTKPQTVSAIESPQVSIITIEGKVTVITNGKDGFTATVIASDGQSYQSVVSRANLKDPQQYRLFKLDEMVRLTGEWWMMNNQSQLVVRKIL